MSKRLSWKRIKHHLKIGAVYGAIIVLGALVGYGVDEKSASTVVHELVKPECLKENP
jgi:hypothetical protein